MCSNINAYLCVQKIKIKHLTKFSKDMDFEPLSRVLEHYTYLTRESCFDAETRWRFVYYYLLLYSSP